MMTTWDFEGYWNTVIGSNRSAADVVREFDIVAKGLDEWLGSAEESAASAGGLDPADLPEEWSAHHLTALAKLNDALSPVETH